MKPVSSAKSSPAFLRDECSSGHRLASPGEAQLATERVSVTSPALDAPLGFPILLLRSQRAVQDLKRVSMAAAEQLPPARRALGMLAGAEMPIWQPGARKHQPARFAYMKVRGPILLHKYIACRDRNLKKKNRVRERNRDITVPRVN